MEVLGKALHKRATGQKPTQIELRALAKHDREERIRTTAAFTAAVPGAAWRRMTGLGRHDLARLAREHGLPLDGITVDLGRVLPGVFRALSVEVDPMAAGGDSPGLERYRNAKADLAEMEVKRVCGELSDRAEMRQGLMAIATIFRNGAERLEKVYGAGARIQFDQTVDDAVDEINRMFAPEGEEP